jgi:ubiquinone/menaquinone biosynthesis C-methylase UbiE
VFGEDYLYFYETFLTDEVSDRQTDLIWRLLELEPGADVLDLACGHGRIASRLAARGARVTGLDADEFFLARARESGGDVEYLHGDMRALPWTEPRFDAVVMWFTVFGYFDDETNAEVLRGARRVLRSGGRLLIELNHLPWVLGHFRAQSWRRRDADAALDEFEWNPRTSVMTTRRTYLRAGSVREISYGVRMYMPAELRDLLLAAGFSRVDLLNLDGEQLTSDDRRLIVRAHA